MLGDGVVCEVREAVFQLLRVVVFEGEAQVAILVKPDREGIPPRDEHPLPNVELLPLNDHGVLDVLLGNPPGLGTAAHANLQDLLQAGGELNASATALARGLQHPNVLEAIDVELRQQLPRRLQDLFRGHVEGLICVTTTSAASSLVSSVVGLRCIVVAGLRRRGFVASIALHLRGLLRLRCRRRLGLQGAPSPRLELLARLLQGPALDRLPLAVAYRRLWRLVEGVVHLCAPPLAHCQCRGHRSPRECLCCAGLGTLAAVGHKAAQQASARRGLKVLNEVVHLYRTGQVEASREEAVNVHSVEGATIMQAVA
mmetsp:Transcript_3768/g.7721  ORF Transcript_3768/g.7721 Transcript_3768/m.7721 type:complete len:313 (+) Transcript_3768:708-1646(+)